MKVFVLGATGYVGSAVAQRLRDAGHTVVGLARSEEAAAALADRGDEVVRGDLLDLDALRAGASQADAVIDTAIAKDWTLPGEVLAKAATTIIDALPDGAPCILTTGAGLYGATSGEVITEDSPRNPLPMLAHLPAVEDLVLGAERIRGIVIRPTMVYGNGGSIAVTSQLDQVRQAGGAVYLDAGDQLLSTVHVEDLAELFVLALGAPGGTVLNGTDRPPITRRELAEALATASGVDGAARSISMAEASQILGPAAGMLTLSADIANDRARALGWTPSRIGLIADLTTGSYRTT